MLFEQALKDIDVLGAEVIDSVVIPNFSNLKNGQWCADFREDLEMFLKVYSS